MAHVRLREVESCKRSEREERSDISTHEVCVCSNCETTTGSNRVSLVNLLWHHGGSEGCGIAVVTPNSDNSVSNSTGEPWFPLLAEDSARGLSIKTKRRLSVQLRQTTCLLNSKGNDGPILGTSCHNDHPVHDARYVNFISEWSLCVPEY